MQFKNLLTPVLNQLAGTLTHLSDDAYKQKSILLNGSTVGGHTRHVIELFTCLLNGYDAGVVNYEKRNRDLAIETNKNFASNLLIHIANNIEQANKTMRLEGFFGEDENEQYSLETNYFREIIYNLEHTIHHMALIRIGINELSNLKLPENFGVASSTTQYKKLCVQ
jgi:hypothetical protein